MKKIYQPSHAEKRKHISEILKLSEHIFDGNSAKLRNDILQGTEKKKILGDWDLSYVRNI